jgi:Flp pilus assembly protein TadG
VGSTTKYGDKGTDERGAAAVEFALVVPLLLMLVFGIVDFGYMVNRVSMVNNAARDAAREGSLAGTQASITATATAALDGVPGTTVTVTCRKPDGTACGSYDADAASGGTTVVTINYEHEMITPIAFIFGDSVNLSRTAQMRIE